MQHQPPQALEKISQRPYGSETFKRENSKPKVQQRTTTSCDRVIEKECKSKRENQKMATLASRNNRAKQTSNQAEDWVGDEAGRAIQEVEVCPDCGQKSLSEVIICKGTRTEKNKGRPYQYVRNFPSNRNSKERPNVSYHIPQCLANRKFNQNWRRISAGAYRGCEFFRWLDNQHICPQWWINENATFRCPGEPCQMRTKPNPGNKKCSNGSMCADCCHKYQIKGFNRCDYGPHNSDRPNQVVSWQTHPTTVV